MNAIAIDPTSGGASSSSMGGAALHAYSHHHQRWPSSHPDPPNVEWRQDENNIGVDREDAMCVEEGSSQVEARCHRWNPVSLHVLDAGFEDNCSVEWVPLSNEDEDENIQESVVQAPSTSLLWYHSRIPSASTSFDSLGLHHPTPSPVTVDTAHYDRTNFSSNSTGVQPELSELDITQISPLSGNPLINWHSPPGFSYYTTTEIESLLGRKRPREGESDDSDNMVNGCSKRRRRREFWVTA